MNDPCSLLTEADQEDLTPDVYDDTYLNMELALPHDGCAEVQYWRVVKRLRDTKDGLPTGTAHDTPILLPDKARDV